MYDPDFMQSAIDCSIDNIKNGGGPFGAVVVKDGKIIAAAGNSVTRDNDPTAHAEVNAIREACRRLGTFDLTGADIYSSCEPCPMCLSAIYWARISNLYFANTKDDADAIGFSDAFIYDELKLPIARRAVHTERHRLEGDIRAFQIWHYSPDKTEY